MLDIKIMQYLEAVHKSKNFTKASHELHVSQPAISEAIASLEKELGFIIMLRTPQKVTFTTEGEEFMRYINKILADYVTIQEVAQELSNLRSASLQLGISPTVGMPIFSLVYTKYMQQWPGVHVQISEGPMREQISKLQDDVLELAYNALPEPGEYKNLKSFPIGRAEVFAVVSPRHPLSKLAKISFADLDGEKIVLLNEDSKIRTVMMEQFVKNDVVPHIISSHYQVLAMLQMVKISNSIGFIDDSPGCSYVAQLKDKFILIPFEKPVVFPVGFIAKENRRLSKAARNLIALVKESLAK